MLLPVVVACALAPACADVGEIDGDDRVAWRLFESVSDGAYLEGGFVKLNREPFPTALNDSEMVNVYVSVGDAAAFWAIDPDIDGSGVELAPDAVIVREVVAAGELAKLTVMVRGADGYYAGGGDFCYAVTDPEGAHFLAGDGGEPLRGRVGDCAACHADRAGDGFLFGVPAAYKIPDRP
jgi:hypothetical protein